MDENIKQLEIIEKYEEFVNYIYPICINIPKGGHVTLRNKMTEYDELYKSLVSWYGHIQWANSYNLKQYIGRQIENYE